MKWFLPILMILIIIPGLHYTGLIKLFNPNSVPTEDNKNWSPIPSPHLKAQNLKGEGFSLKQLQGQTILLNFWASWCLPCYKEFPELVATVKWAEGNISLVAISVDSSKKDIEKFLRQITKEQRYKKNWYHQNIHIVWDPEFEIAKQFHVVRFPETFILDKDLKITKKYTGFFSLKKAKSFLIKFLPVEEPK